MHTNPVQVTPSRRPAAAVSPETTNAIGKRYVMTFSGRKELDHPSAALVERNRKGKVRLLLVLGFAITNSILDILFAISLTRGYGCAPSQDSPMDAQLYTLDMSGVAVAVAVVGAVLTFGFHLIGAYKAFRADEVYGLTRPLKIGRMGYFFLTDLPLLGCQAVLFSRVGVPRNFYYAKAVFSVTSAFLNGWNPLVDALDRCGVCWGPFREHRRFTVGVCSFCIGVLLLGGFAFVWPTPLPAGVEVRRVELLVRKHPTLESGCAHSLPTDDTILMFQSDSVPTFLVGNSPVIDGDRPDFTNSKASPMFMTLSSTVSDITVTEVPRQRVSFQFTRAELYSTRDKDSAFGFKLFMDFELVAFSSFAGVVFTLFPGQVSPVVPVELFPEATLEGVIDKFDEIWWKDDLCVFSNATANHAVWVTCSELSCSPENPHFQVGFRVRGNGLECRPF